MVHCSWLLDMKHCPIIMRLLGFLALQPSTFIPLFSTCGQWEQCSRTIFHILLKSWLHLLCLEVAHHSRRLPKELLQLHSMRQLGRKRSTVWPRPWLACRIGQVQWQHAARARHSMTARLAQIGTSSAYWTTSCSLQLLRAAMLLLMDARLRCTYRDLCMFLASLLVALQRGQ